MKIFVLTALMSSVAFGATAAKCPQIDPAKKFPDGIPYCPAAVVTEDAWSVMGCAFSQAKKWHAATADEKTHMTDLVQGLKDAKADVILAKSDVLKLQVCRSQVLDKKNQLDSFLVMYTKPGVTDYSGPFLMYREGGKTTNLVIQSPHDGTDNAHSSTKRAFQDSNSLAMLSNGHHKTLSLRLYGDTKRQSDWSHSRADLGYTAFLALRDKFPESVHMHIHGCKAKEIMVTDAVGWDGAKHDLRTAFMNASQKALDDAGSAAAYKVVIWRFNGWTPSQDLTKGPDGKTRAANQRFVGAEINVGLHSRKFFLSRIVQNLENDYLNKPVVVPPVPEVDEELEETPEDPAAPAIEPVDPPEAAPVGGLPPMGVNKGTKKLLCIGVKYSTGPIGATKAACEALGVSLTDFWKRNSRGALVIEATAMEPFESGLEGNKGDWKKAKANYEKAVEAIKVKYPAYDYYVIPGIYTGPHAANKVAYVKSAQAMTATHETGHLIGLAHAGAYVDGVLNAYADTDSIMGRIISKFITAPQYHYLGWLKPEEVAHFDPKVPFYELGKIGDWQGLQTVLIQPKNKASRYAFISATRCSGAKATPACVSLHLTGGRGSQKVFEVENEGWDSEFTGLHVKVLKATATSLQVKIDYEKKPS